MKQNLSLLNNSKKRKYNIRYKNLINDEKLEQSAGSETKKEPIDNLTGEINEFYKQFNNDVIFSTIDKNSKGISKEIIALQEKIDELKKENLIVVVGNTKEKREKKKNKIDRNQTKLWEISSKLIEKVNKKYAEIEDKNAKINDIFEKKLNALKLTYEPADKKIKDDDFSDYLNNLKSSKENIKELVKILNDLKKLNNLQDNLTIYLKKKIDEKGNQVFEIRQLEKNVKIKTDEFDINREKLLNLDIEIKKDNGYKAKINKKLEEMVKESGFTNACWERLLYDNFSFRGKISPTKDLKILKEYNEKKNNKISFFNSWNNFNKYFEKLNKNDLNFVKGYKLTRGRLGKSKYAQYLPETLACNTFLYKENIETYKVEVKSEGEVISDNEIILKKKVLIDPILVKKKKIDYPARYKMFKEIYNAAQDHVIQHQINNYKSYHLTFKLLEQMGVAITPITNYLISDEDLTKIISLKDKKENEKNALLTKLGKLGVSNENDTNISITELEKQIYDIEKKKAEEEKEKALKKSECINKFIENLDTFLNDFKNSGNLKEECVDIDERNIVINDISDLKNRLQGKLKEMKNLRESLEGKLEEIKKKIKDLQPIKNKPESTGGASSSEYDSEESSLGESSIDSFLNDIME